MVTVSIREAKNRFHKLVRLAEAGETVTVTRYGKPVMDIVVHLPGRQASSGPRCDQAAAQELSL